MTAIVPTSRVPPGHYGFRQAARMEWIKLRTLRSVKWALLVALAGMAGIGIAAGFNTRNAHGDVTNNILAGGALGQVVFAVLGVLVMTSEYSSGDDPGHAGHGPALAAGAGGQGGGVRRRGAGRRGTGHVRRVPGRGGVCPRRGAAPVAEPARGAARGRDVGRLLVPDRAERARAGHDRPPRRCRDRGAVRAGADWGGEVLPELIYADSLGATQPQAGSRCRRGPG